MAKVGCEGVYTQCVPETIGPCLFTQRCTQSWPCTFTMSWCCRILHVVLITRHAMPHTYPQERNGTVQVVLLGQQSVGKVPASSTDISIAHLRLPPKNTIGVAFCSQEGGKATIFKLLLLAVFCVQNENHTSICWAAAPA